jgi:hypothetical protein
MATVIIITIWRRRRKCFNNYMQRKKEREKK